MKVLDEKNRFPSYDRLLELKLYTLKSLISEMGLNETKIRSFMNEILRWNVKIRLMAKGESPEHHVIDSLVLAKHLPKHVSLVDVGTGGGFPGLIVAMARPDLRVTLVEPISKKTSFLTYVTQILEIKNVEIITDRIENLSHRHWDNAVCKAFTDIKTWTSISSKIAHILWYYPSSSNIDLILEDWQLIEQWMLQEGKKRFLVRKFI